MRKKLFVKLFTALIGLIFFCVGSYMLNSNIELSNRGEKTKGIVMEIGEERNSDGDLMYYPIVKFSDKWGKEYIVPVSSERSNPIGYDVGDSISLIYHRNNPASVRINTVFWMYIFPSIFILGGLLALKMAYSIRNF